MGKRKLTKIEPEDNTKISLLPADELEHIKDTYKRRIVDIKPGTYDNVSDITAEESDRSEATEKKRKKKEKKDKERHVKSEIVSDMSDAEQRIPEPFKEPTAIFNEESVEIAQEAEGNEAEPSNGDEKRRKKDGPHTRSLGVNLSTALKKYAENQILTYEEGLRRIREDPKCGLCVKLQQRHVSLPYHMAGAVASNHAFQFIANSTLGRYRRELQGVVVAIGDVRAAQYPRVLDDQNVLHTDAVIKQIVFRPKIGDTYRSLVRHISKDIIVALIMDAITVHVAVDDKFDLRLKGSSLEIGDTIMVKYKGMRIKKALCHLQGEFLGIMEKKESIDVKPVLNRTTFDEDDEDSE
ncbi:unnamed protein product [Caenorhabditis auriculariae]|uniref:Uncharacterized protein n=1 Tax=Caenorhabditis auriculariae TaxID=2777116 RepID=A0A8S1HT63_9PELO|nr:unnamed protein product [Caenorhabditis auriculariae]